MQTRGQGRPTLAELCSAIESGMLPAEVAGDSYAVKQADLAVYALRRVIRRIGPARAVQRPSA